MNFVVDDEAPIALVEQLEVRELLGLLVAVGEDLIGGERHRADVLRVAGVLGDLVLGEVGLVEDFAVPLLDGGDAGGQHQRGALHHGHRRDADDGLAGPAGQDDDAAAAANVAAGIKDVGRFALIIAHDEGQPAPRHLAQVNRQSRAFGVAGQVFRGIADRDQRLLQHTAKGRIDEEAVPVEPLPKVSTHLRLPGQFFEQSGVVADEA